MRNDSITDPEWMSEKRFPSAEQLRKYGMIAGIIVLLLLMLVVGSPIGTVGAGERGVQLRFDAVTGRVLGEGLYFRWPIIERVIKLDIMNEVVARTGITKTKAEMAVETVFESMKKALQKGDRIELRGFGVFNVKPRKTGIGRNPRTGAEVSIPPGKAVRFKPGKELQSLP